METHPTPSATPLSRPAAGGRAPVLRGLLLLGLVVLCGAGLVLDPFRPQNPRAFWTVAVALFGALCFGVCLLGGRGRSRREVLLDQALLWLGAAVLVQALLWLIERQRLSPEAAGPAAVMLIAFAVFVSGVRFAWTLLSVALLLVAAVAGAVLLERIVLLVGGLILVLLLAVFFLRPFLSVFRGPRSPEPPSGPAAGAA